MDHHRLLSNENHRVLRMFVQSSNDLTFEIKFYLMVGTTERRERNSLPIPTQGPMGMTKKKMPDGMLVVLYDLIKSLFILQAYPVNTGKMQIKRRMMHE